MSAERCALPMAPFKGVNDRGVAGFMGLKQMIGRECLLDFYQHLRHRVAHPVGHRAAERDAEPTAAAA
jgi:hypothetical protein